MIAGTLRRAALEAVESIPLAGLARTCAPVVTYHSCSPELPENTAPVDNISPEALYRQLDTLRRHYRFVPIDELAEARSTKGLAAVTFDDGYQNVTAYALGIFAALRIPFTIFVSAFSLEGRVFWRHKTQYVVEHGLAAECEAWFTETRPLPGLGLYEYLKDPANNSAAAERELDAFLAAKGVALDGCRHLLDGAARFERHPLVSYGNHTRNHYVLSSLSYEGQCEEIERGMEPLRAIPGIRLSAALSAPFGESRHVNADTFRAAEELGYKAVLMNRGGLNRGQLPARNGVRTIERFTGLDEPIERLIKRNAVKGLLRRARAA